MIAKVALLALLALTAVSARPTPKPRLPENWETSYQAGTYGLNGPVPFLYDDQSTIVSAVFDGNSMNWTLVASNASTGEMRWSTSLGMRMKHPHISQSNKTLYACTGTHLIALSQETGVIQWKALHGCRHHPVAARNSGTIIAYTSATLRGFDAKTGNVTWSVSAQFGSCSFFPEPMISQKAGAFFVCGRGKFTGEQGLAAYDVTTGDLLYFKQHDNINPYYVDDEMIVFQYFDNSESGMIVEERLVPRTGAKVWRWFPYRQHGDGVVFKSLDLCIIGTQHNNSALNLTTGERIWYIASPAPPLSDSYPIVVGDKGIAIFHDQTLGQYNQTLRRLNPRNGSVMWDSYLVVNGDLQWHYFDASSVGSSSSSLLSTFGKALRAQSYPEGILYLRTQHNIYGIDWATGAQVVDMDFREAQVSVWGTNAVFVTKDNSLKSYGLVPKSPRV